MWAYNIYFAFEQDSEMHEDANCCRKSVITAVHEYFNHLSVTGEYAASYMEDYFI